MLYSWSNKNMQKLPWAHLIQKIMKESQEKLTVWGETRTEGRDCKAEKGRALRLQPTSEWTEASRSYATGFARDTETCFSGTWFPKMNQRLVWEEVKESKELGQWGGIEWFYLGHDMLYHSDCYMEDWFKEVKLSWQTR